MPASNSEPPNLKPTRLLDAALWQAGFRPFYLLGAIYAPVSLLAWILASRIAWFDATWAPALFHGHEMLFGFTAAVVVGFILTALPSWAEIPHIERGPLALLAGAWLVGRLAVWASPILPPMLVGIADSALYGLMVVLVGPGLLRAADKRYLVLLPIILALLAANLAFHAGAVSGDAELASRALEAALYTYMVLFTIVGGLLIPVFTENSLRRGDGRANTGGWPGYITYIPTLEYTAVAAMVAVALTGLFMPGTPVAGVAALLALVILGGRMARWQTHRCVDIAIIWVLHAGFAWLLVALALRALNDFGLLADPTTAFHAFTVGALGMMKIGLMTRVVLRHTGRPVKASGAMVAAFVMIAAATVLRLLADSADGTNALVMVSSALWGLAYMIYVIEFTAMLMRPSLPRTAQPAKPSS